MKFIPLFCIIFWVSCQSKSLKQQENIEAKITKSENWTKYSTKDSIPEVLIEKISHLSLDNFTIANPNDNFNATDAVLDKNLPWRQLRLLCKSGDFWTIAYVHGGFASHYHVILAEILSNKIKQFKIGTTSITLESISQLKNALEGKKIEFKSPQYEDGVDKA